ncbi:MAG: HDOD domain-containing protein [Desulfobacteraceae bacterium]|jgi:HD-like signal output (HDOD) protein
MNIACKSCNSAYDLPDNRLPMGKVVSFPCPACKSKVTLDLREPASEPESPDATTESVPDSTDKVVFKPLDESSESALETDDLKKKILKRIKDLPPMPKVLFKARQVMDDPKSGFKEIAKIIETDQAIAAKVLKVANSAYYGLSGMVNSIHQATVVLGYETLEQVITMVSSSSLLGKQLKGYSLNAGVLWRHSLAVALASRIIAKKRAPSLEGDAFSVGLIHDAGKLALDGNLQQKKKEVRDFLENKQMSFLKAERHILGFDHTEIAHDLCQKWKLPEDHAEAMRFHHSPEESNNNQLAHIVHVADYIAKQAEYGTGPAFDCEPLYPSSLEELQLKPQQVEEITEEMIDAVEKITESLK